MISTNTLLQFSKLTDMASSVLAVLTGGVDAVTDILFAFVNVFLTIIFHGFFLIIYALHQILLEFVLIRPVPRNSSGDIVIMGTGVEEPFTSFASVIDGYLEPFAMVLVLLGVAILLFLRIFDVVIDVGVDVEKAQKRLLLAPIFILLWIPIANIVLSLGYGLTEIFMNMNVKFDPTAFSGLKDVYLDGSGELDIKNYVLSIAPGVSLNAFTADTTLSMFIGISLMGPAALIYIIGVVAAAFRVVGIYIFYITGPISIALWASSWRDLSDIGKRYIKYFILLALFPVPAALLNTLIPILALSIENALMIALSGAFSTGGGASSATGSSIGFSSNPISALGLGGVIRAIMIIVIPVIIGFAPWVFVIGVNGAMKVAGGAAIGTAAVATGGAVAMGAGSSMLSKGASAASSKAMSKSSKLSSAAKRGSKIKGSVGEKAGGVTSRAKELGGKVPGSGKAKMGAQYAVTGANYAKKHRKNIQRGVSSVAKKHSNNSAINAMATGLEKEADMEDNMRDRLTKARDTFGGLKHVDEDGELTQEGVSEIDRQVLSDKMSLSEARTALNTVDGFSYDENLTEDEMRRKGSKAIHQVYEESDSLTEVKDTLGDPLENSVSGKIENIKYHELLEKAQQKGLEDAFLSSDYVNGNLSDKNQELRMAKANQSELYSENWEIFNESGLTEKERKKAVKETDKARDAVEEDIDIGGLKSVSETDEFLKAIFGDSKLQDKGDAEKVIDTLVGKIGDDATIDQLEDLDSIQKLMEENESLKGADSADSLIQDVGNYVKGGKLDYEKAQEISEDIVKEMYFKDGVSEEYLNDEIDALMELDRSDVNNIVNEISERPETARKSNAEKIVKSLETPGEYYDVEESFNQILGELDDEVRKEAIKEIENMELGASLDDLDVKVSGEEIDIVEELREPVETALDSVGSGLADEIAREAEDFEPVVRDAITDMNMMDKSNINKLAEKTSELHETALDSIVDHIDDQEIASDLKNKIHKNGELSSSDISDLNQEVVENLTVGIEATQTVDTMDDDHDKSYQTAVNKAFESKDKKGTSQTINELRDR